MNDRAPDSFFFKKGGEDVEGRGRKKWIEGRGRKKWIGHGRDGIVRKRKWPLLWQTDQWHLVGRDDKKDIGLISIETIIWRWPKDKFHIYILF
jgi:hypothetical protein